MHRNKTRTPRADDGGPRAIVVIAVLGVALAVVLVVWASRRRAPESPDPAASTAATPGPEQDAAGAPPPSRPAGPRTTVVKAGRPPRPAPASSPGTPESQQLVGSLVKPVIAAGGQGADQAAMWRARLAQLIEQGNAGIPAIREFLDKDMDFDFGSAGRQTLGYDTARLAMLDALGRIGGQDALEVMTGVLQRTADPRELGLLAKNLEKVAPGQYRDQALAAARQALEMARAGQLQGYDVAPLFDVIQRYGGAEAVPELENATGQWRYYATRALAEMPDGTGIPSLVRMTTTAASTSPRGARDIALEMLAQVANQYPDARETLISQVQANRVPANSWSFLSSVLAGDQALTRDTYDALNLPLEERARVRSAYHVTGNQHLFYAPPADGLSADELNQQLALVEELRSVATDPVALDALQQARLRIEQRLTQPGATGQPGG